MIKVETPFGIYSYTYDAFNRRMSKNGAKYLWDGKNEIGTANGELRILGEGLGAEIGSAVFIKIKDKIFTPIHDIQGNLVVLNGEAYRYTAFGEELTSSRLSPGVFQANESMMRQDLSILGEGIIPQNLENG